MLSDPRTLDDIPTVSFQLLRPAIVPAITSSMIRNIHQAITSDIRTRKDVPLNRFDELVRELRDALGSSSGLGSDDVDVPELESLMREYNSSPDEWSRFAFSDASRGYTRNLVDEGNGKSNLVSNRPEPKR
jgi:Cysteine dioxygenase type I